MFFGADAVAVGLLLLLGLRLTLVPRLEELHRKRWEALVSQVAADGRAAMRRGGEEELGRLLRRWAQRYPKLAHLVVRESGNGRVVAEASGPREGPPGETGLAKDGPLREIEVALSQSPRMRLEARIRGDEEERSVDATRDAVVLVCAIAFIAGIASFFVGMRRLLRPMSRLQAIARETDQDFGRTGGDEIGALVRSVSNMSEDLGRTSERLSETRTDLARRNRELEGERRRLRTMLDAMSEGIAFTDASHRVILVNAAAARMARMTVDEALGRRIDRIPLPGVVDGVRRSLRRLAAGDSEAVEAGDDGDGDFSVRIAPVRRPSGEHLGAVLVIRDLREQRAFERERETFHARLAQQEKMFAVGQTAASVAHELNTPLGTVLIHSQLLRARIRDRASRAALLQIEQEVLRCRGIVKNLLEFSRSSEGTRRPEDLMALVRRCVSLLDRDLREKKIRVRLRAEGDARPVVVDANGILQVLLNLLRNATDAMPEGGEIRVAIREGRDPAGCRIEVADTGPGIPPEIRPRIFEPFFTTKEPGRGTGLGLAICRRIVKAHDGEIELDLRVRRGTTFRLFLPSAPS